MKVSASVSWCTMQRCHLGNAFTTAPLHSAAHLPNVSEGTRLYSRSANSPRRLVLRVEASTIVVRLADNSALGGSRCRRPHSAEFAEALHSCSRQRRQT